MIPGGWFCGVPGVLAMPALLAVRAWAKGDRAWLVATIALPPQPEAHRSGGVRAGGVSGSTASGPDCVIAIDGRGDRVPGS